jgi:uncharacterized hydrophobic protein (TIGR00271 family)
MKALLAVFAEPDLALLPWARQISRSIGSDVLGLLCVAEGGRPQLVELSGQGKDRSELAQAALAQIEDPDAAGVVILDAIARKRSKAVLEGIVEFEPELLILPAPLSERQDKAAATIERLVRVAPTDVLVLEAVGHAPDVERILIPMREGAGALAIRLAARGFEGSTKQLVALADPDALPRSQRVFDKALGRLSEEQQKLARLEQADESLDASLAAEFGEDGGFDLILTEIEDMRRVRKRAEELAALRASSSAPHPALGLVRDSRVAGPGRLERYWERVRTHLPHLDRNQKREVYQSLERGGRLSTDYLVMLLLSTGIATLGLIQDSTAVVVGAMLVAPLMTPIVATGLALVQGNRELFRKATQAMLIGVGAGLLTAMLLALTSPWPELSSEVLARGTPNLFDFGIALLSGIAGAFAIARPGAASALAGVAIAVALVPPLAAIGIALVKGFGMVAFGAAVLFLTNLVAIITGSGIVFRLFGIDLQGRETPRWVRATMLTLGGLALPILAVLVHNLQEQLQHGAEQRIVRSLDAETRSKALARIDAAEGVDLIYLAESEPGESFGVRVVLSTEKGRDPALQEQLERMLREDLGEDAKIHVRWLTTAR